MAYHAKHYRKNMWKKTQCELNLYLIHVTKVICLYILLTRLYIHTYILHTDTLRQIERDFVSLPKKYEAI
jgi:hypothetical protein